MKLSKTRKAQQDYIRSTFNDIPELEAITKNIELVSISARYAQEHETDKEAFDDSGMGQLFEILQTIAKTDGIKIKQQTPLKNFRAYLNTFDKDLQLYKDFLAGFNQPLTDLTRNIPPAVSKETSAIKNQLATFINKKFAELEPYRDDEAQIQSRLKTSQQALFKESQNLLSQAKINVINETMKNFGDSMVAVVDSSDMLELPEFKVEKKKEKYIKSIKEGTKNRNSGIGGILGGIVGGVGGFFLGGPLGALAGVSAGSTVGSLLGSATGDDASQEIGEITVNVGDNLSDIKLKYHDLFEQSISNEMANFESVLLEKSVTEATEFMEKVKMEIDTLQKQFDQKLTDIDKKLQ